MPPWPVPFPSPGHSSVSRRVFSRGALFLFVLAAPALLRAQFHDPTLEELKMTADPKAPGAAAVYLNVEETTNDEVHFRSVYFRIKVLQEKGKELATVEVPYDQSFYKIVAIKGRTIHSDGTIIPLTGKPEDLLVEKKGDDKVARKVFNLPSVEVGSILEYSFQLNYDDHTSSSPFWQIQRPYFVHKAHYSFTPFKAFLRGPDGQTNMFLTNSKGGFASHLLSMSILPPGVELKADAIGRYTLDLSDIPAIPNEEWMPPIQAVLYKVLFYYHETSGSTEFWANETKRWSKDVDHFAEPSKPIHEAVTSIAAPGDSSLDKARKIYKAVQALDNTDFSRTKAKTELKQLGLREARRAEDTWVQKSGSSQDTALLYIALARAAGLDALAMRVVNRDRGLFSAGYLNFDQLDDDIVILKIDGKEIFLDPGEKMCPFLTIDWKHSAAGGIRQNSDGHVAYSPFPVYTANTLSRSGDLVVDPSGVVTGDIQFILSGQLALLWRQAALEIDPAKLKDRFDRWLSAIVPNGIDAHLDHFLGLDDPDVNLIATVKLHGTLATATSKRLLLPAFFFETRGNHPFIDQEKRLEPVDMHFGEQITDKITYHLPPGFSVEAAPQNAQIPWDRHAIFMVKSTTDPDQISITRQFARGFTILKAEDYQDLRAFYQKVAASDQQQLILVATPESKGN